MPLHKRPSWRSILLNRRLAAGRLLLAALFAAGAVAGPVLTSATPALASVSGVLSDGSVLPSGGFVSSPNGRYVLRMQKDGNLVLYVCGRALWDSHTWNNPGAWAAMKSGVLEVVDPHEGTPIKQFGASGYPGAALYVQSDGNLVIYRPGGIDVAHALFVSNTVTNYTPKCGGSRLLRGQSWTSPNGAFNLVLQSDGNLVLYHRIGTSNTPVWSYGGGPGSGAWAIMQPDGNFVLYSSPYPSTATFVWASGTYNNSGAYLAVQNDGSLAIYSRSGNTLWVSGISFVWPASGKITQNAAEHRASENGTSAEDIANAAGTPIVAAAGGTVTFAGTTSDQYYCKPLGRSTGGDGFGNFVVIKHAGASKTYFTLYAHMNAVAASAGQPVQRGDIIGYMGTTGCSTGNHVHFEIGTCTKGVYVAGSCTLWNAIDPREGTYVTQGAATGGNY